MTPSHAGVGVLLLGLLGCQAAPDGWLYATRVTSSSAVVAWSGHAARLRCREAGGEPVATAIAIPWRGIIEARLEGLRPATRHVCRLTTDGARRRTLRFRTAPAAGVPFRFAVVGDTGDFSPEAFALARRIRAGRPDFLIHLGDLAYPSGTMIQLHRRFFRPYRRVLERVPLYTTPGNHDASSRAGYAQAFAPLLDPSSGARSYAFEWAGTHFVSVSSPDADHPQAGIAQWLERQLLRLPRDAWRIVFLHEPPYNPGTADNTPGIQGNLAPILQAAHVDLLLAGHEHLYARSEPICDFVPGSRLVQVISGGGGANLDKARPRRRANFPVVASKTHYVRVTVTPGALDVRAIGVDGSTLDRARLARGQGPCRSDGWPRPNERSRRR